MSALSLDAAGRMLDDLADAFRADARVALGPRDMADLLRGAARDDDGAAVALFARLGLSARETLTLLPQARAIADARRNAGA